MLVISISAQLVWYFLAKVPCPTTGEMPQLLGAPCSPSATVASLQEIQNVSGIIMLFGFILLPIGLFKDGLPIPGPGAKIFLGVLLVLITSLASTYVLTIPVSAPAHVVSSVPCGTPAKGSTVYVCMTTFSSGLPYGFSPANITVVIGLNNTVLWSNNGGTTHTTTSFPPGQAESWNSGDLNVGQTFTFTFSTAGTYTYYCAIHPFMRGTIIVKPK